MKMYTVTGAVSSRADNPLDPDRQRRRNAFARSAVWANFRHRDARALDFDDFTDREPWQRPPTAAEAELC